jgi:hypothetical protein
MGMTRYRSLWTIGQSWLTFYLLAQGIGLGNMQSYTLHTLSTTTISQRPSYLIGDLSLWRNLWEQLHESLGIHLIQSLAYHPQIDGQIERVNQIIEDMLSTCLLNDDPKWDQYLPLAEFSYNNRYQESIKMSPFEALHGQSCRTPLSWSEYGERVIFGPYIMIEAEEKVRQIQANILNSQSLHKSYTDKRRRALKFEVGDLVYLCISPMKGVRRFGIKGKLAPRYIGLYPILEKYGPLAY